MKKISNLFAVIALVALAFGSLQGFMFGGILSALAMGTNYSPDTLSVCATSCEIDDIESSDECNIRGGLKTVYWAQYGDVDWETMAADPTAFDPVNQCILSYIMNDGATFKKLTFERKQGFYDFTYTEDADVYEQIITMIFEGKSKANRNAFCKAIGCCKIILHIFDNNCLERVVGVEWDGELFEPQVKTLRIVRHLDSSGQFGSSKARDEVDFGGESVCPPLFGQVGQTAIPV